ncbi:MULTISPECIES: toxin-antitoxin system, toxin component family protein [unclassified Streptomyces]|uniref:toxin-antitoxin system, toxin component family protein n=1 Tax=unclassified Streptomyces TaxID=2593676 RepID=UPI00225C06A0|nr:MULTISPECIES: toxin-antitoxin system, toxin component family protein [unclassified Streptomyces]MCX5057371.1 toxin-antitoxin system, toxin component family protein [Streptomyces sp. NBC_00452]MCX5245753.1 toxin-antitoxin system, toxin component family protein [Streptomyces sp. NBC_00201]MCX5288445.1 toxin-antitoxin system, toxin component family protein [Streptomyces sp. NBC_00183]
MGVAGARKKAARLAAGLRRSRRASSGMRKLTKGLGAAVRARSRPPADARELCRVLCEEMRVRRGGRPVELRFERFPDEIEVTGLWVEFQDFDLVIVEERAEAVQQLVILGHELWHLHAGHSHHHVAGAALADRHEWNAFDDAALSVAARDGSRVADEAEADDFGHRLAAAFRPLLSGGSGRSGQDTVAPLDPLRRSLGYRGRGGTAR